MDLNSSLHKEKQARHKAAGSCLHYGNAPRNLICAFHALSLLSLIYPTWCVGVFGCETCFPSMVSIPLCSCQQEGENVWQELAGFSKRQEQRAALLWALSGLYAPWHHHFVVMNNYVSHNTGEKMSRPLDDCRIFRRAFRNQTNETALHSLFKGIK